MVGHDIRTFTWTGKHGVAELSSMPPLWVTATFDDAGVLKSRCFEVFNVKTGARKRFMQVAMKRPTNDSLLWLFASSDGFSITIFND